MVPLVRLDCLLGWKGLQTLNMLLSCAGIPLGETGTLSQETRNPNFLLLCRRQARKETVRREMGQAIYSVSVCDLKISIKNIREIRH